MTIRDLQADFSFTSGSPSTSIIGAAGTYVCANAYDTGPLAGYLTELSAGDTLLSANSNAGRDLGGGERLWLVIDWVTAAAGGTNVDVQLITSATAALGTPVVVNDFTAIPTATLVKGYRQIQAMPRSASYLEFLGVQAITTGTFTAGAFIAWIGKDIDSIVQGYASGFAVK